MGEEGDEGEDVGRKDGVEGDAGDGAEVGVALRRDSLEMQDHGAVCAVTFNDAGLPSTTGLDAVRPARGCLASVAEHHVDVIVAELGDGLMGEYGVADVLAAPDVRAQTRAVILAATDPVAGWGGVQLLKDLGYETTVVTGPATDNSAGTNAIESRCNTPAINAFKDAEAFADCVVRSLGLTLKAVPQIGTAG